MIDLRAVSEVDLAAYLLPGDCLRQVESIADVSLLLISHDICTNINRQFKMVDHLNLLQIVPNQPIMSFRAKNRAFTVSMLGEKIFLVGLS